jgi:O-antigen/teichoic acid export membrane protein
VRVEIGVVVRPSEMSNGPSKTIGYSPERLTNWWSVSSIWLGKGFLAILDQGLISTSNFVVGVLLARWLLPGQYGVYALAFSIFLYFSQVYQSLVLEPMAVFGGSTYRDCLPAYLRALLRMHLAATLGALVILYFLDWMARIVGWPNGLRSAIAAVTVATPCILLFWLARRAFYLQLSPAPAATGAFLYCILVFGGLLLLCRSGSLSPSTAFLLMGFAALATGVLLLFRFWQRHKCQSPIPGPSLRETWHQHWGYGRWALASTVVIWIPYNIYYPIVSTLFGMTHAGELRALMNLSLPIVQSAIALSMLFLTHGAAIHQKDGAAGIRNFSRRISALYLGGAILYCILLISFRPQVVHMLYGENYTSIVSLVPLLALASVLQVVVVGPGIGLRAMESPASVFAAYCAASAVTLLIGIPLTQVYGVRGAVLGMIFSNLCALGVEVALLGRSGASSREVTVLNVSKSDISHSYPE